MTHRKMISRRKFVQASAVGTALLTVTGRAAQLAKALPASKSALPNILIFITDQDRGVLNFPPNWERDNLPGLTRLKRNGLTFENAFTNSCMCTAARVTWLTGYFPAQHGCKYTLEEDMPAPQYPQAEMPLPLAAPDDSTALTLPNLATVMSAAGYNVVYKGKWHCSKPAFGDAFVPEDLGRYGFSRWNPPDGGANQDVSEGGGAPSRDGNHDDRYIYDNGDWEQGEEGVLAFLASEAARQQPFCLVVSLVNPHDVLAYPTNFDAFGYTDEWLKGEIQLPETLDDNMQQKPAVQRQLLRLLNALGPLDTKEKKLAYLNFYGNLMKHSDGYLVKVLDALEASKLLNDTLVIRTADHGEMGLAHGGMRQKNFNFYEESMRIPLVFSNPKMFPGGRSTKALVSHVDFLPTMASLVGAPLSARSAWQGVDYSSVILQSPARPVQDYIAFTFDDYQAGQKTGPYAGEGSALLGPRVPNHIISIREARYKLAQYYAPDGTLPAEFEMYDLLTDPKELRNLAHASYRRTPEQERQFNRLREKLTRIAATRLVPL